MANVSIYAGLLGRPTSVDEYDRAAQNEQLNQLQILQGQQKLDAVTRTNKRADQLQQLARGLPADVTDEGRIAALRGGGYFDEADALDKSIQGRAKTRADIASTQATTAKTQFETQKKQFDHVIGGLQQFGDAAQARDWLIDSVTAGQLPMSTATQMIKTIPADPQQFGAWRDKALQGTLDAKEQAALKFAPASAVLTAETSRKNNEATNARQAADAAAQRALVASEGEKNRNVKTTAIKAANDRADRKGKGQGAMSPTLQKELIEQDDTVATAQSTIGNIKKALDLNDKIDTGWRAVDRAKIRVQLPGDSSKAKATLDYDNLVGTQTLGGMKAIFGGNPTEGERAILLELQASADKPADVRKAILERALTAAQRRIDLATARAKAIRGGTYLTEGAGDGSPSLDDAMSGLLD